VEGIATTRRGLILEDLVNRRLRAELVVQTPSSESGSGRGSGSSTVSEELPIYLLGICPICPMGTWAGKGAQGPDVSATRPRIAVRSPPMPPPPRLPAIEVPRGRDQCLELGFKAIKWHAWENAREDARLAEALRAHVGGSIDLMYDGSAGFDLPDAIYSRRALLARDFAGTKSRCGSSASRHNKWLSDRVPNPAFGGGDLRRCSP